MNGVYVYMRFTWSSGEKNAAFLHSQSRQGSSFRNI